MLRRRAGAILSNISEGNGRAEGFLAGSQAALATDGDFAYRAAHGTDTVCNFFEGTAKGLAVLFLAHEKHAGHVGLVVEELSEHLHLVQGEGLDLRRLGLDGLDAAVQVVQLLSEFR